MNKLQKLTEPITDDWNDHADVVRCNGVLQHRNGMAVSHTPLALASLRTHYTLSSRLLVLSLAQTIENQLVSKKWRALYPDNDVKTGAVDILKWSTALQSCLKHNLSDACSGKTQAAKYKLFYSLGYYPLLKDFQARTVEVKVKRVLRYCQQEIGFKYT